MVESVECGAWVPGKRIPARPIHASVALFLYLLISVLACETREHQLLDAAEDTHSWSTRMNAICELGAMDTDRSTRTLETIAGQNEPWHEDERLLAACFLARRNVPLGITILTDVFKERHGHDRRRFAMAMLLELGSVDECRQTIIAHLEHLASAGGDQPWTLWPEYCLARLDDDSAAVTALVSTLVDTLEQRRIEAATILGSTGSSAAIPPLWKIVTSGDEGHDVRHQSARSLCLLSGVETSVIDSLYSLLKEPERYATVRSSVASALCSYSEMSRSCVLSCLDAGSMCHPPFTQDEVDSVLVRLLLDEHEMPDRICVVRAFVELSAAGPTVARLLDTLTLLEQIELAAEYYPSFIRAGGGDEMARLLVMALNGHGDQAMAEAFLNCGDPTLEDAATRWAQKNGFAVTELRVSGGRQELRWGGVPRWPR